MNYAAMPYDFFMADEEHPALVIADASGKGIPAALCSCRAPQFDDITMLSLQYCNR